MLLQKTEKARLELSPGMRTLSLRERSLLLLADGKPLSDLQAMYNGIGAQIVDRLLCQGYLTGPGSPPGSAGNANNAGRFKLCRHRWRDCITHHGNHKLHRQHHADGQHQRRFGRRIRQ